MIRTRFWEKYELEALSEEEWEALCDGCGRCCLVKLQDEDTDALCYTQVSCQYLDGVTCKCTAYKDRLALVPDCIKVTPAIAKYDWLPDSCAYRLLAQGQPLPDWHPLRTGNRHSVIDAGISMRGKVISECFVHEDDLEEHIIEL